MAVFQQSGLSFPGTCEVQSIPLKDASLTYYPGAFSREEADALLAYCIDRLSWRQEHLRIAGRKVAVPRLQNWYGDESASYSYSGLTLHPLPWTEMLLGVRQRVESLCGYSFNALLANYYRNGVDSVSWHSDDEKELGEAPVIASVSLGTTRVFEMKHVSDGGKARRLPLEHGSVLVMAGRTQRFWRHRIPKEPAILTSRVNLTLRRIVGLPSS